MALTRATASRSCAWRHFAVHRPARERIELAAGVALGDQLLRPRRIGRRALLDALRPAVGVDAQPFLHLAAEQLVDRHAELLADDVVERDVDGADGGEHDAAHAVVVEEPVHPVPQLLDVPGALADDDRAQVADRGGDRLDAGEVGAFAPADQAVGGLDPAEEPRPVAADAGQEHGLALGDRQPLEPLGAGAGLRPERPRTGGEQAAGEAEGGVTQERAAAGAAGDGVHGRPAVGSWTSASSEADLLLHEHAAPLHGDAGIAPVVMVS